MKTLKARPCRQLTLQGKRCRFFTTKPFGDCGRHRDKTRATMDYFAEAYKPGNRLCDHCGELVAELDSKFCRFC